MDFDLTCNRNKRSIVLDMKRPEAREVLYRLVAGSDALVHSIRSEPAAKIGMSDARPLRSRSRPLEGGRRPLGAI